MIIDLIYQILYAVMILIVLGFIALFAYFINSKRKQKNKIRNQTNYESLNRKDGRDFLKYDDNGIRDNMIVANNGKRFIAVLRGYGVNYFSLDLEQKYRTCTNFMGFVNSISKPISYRQYSKPIDLTYNIERYKKTHDGVVDKIYNLAEDKKDIQKFIKNNETNLDDAELMLYRDKILEINRQLKSLEFKKIHLEEQIHKLEISSGDFSTPDYIQTWVYDWEYDPDDYSVELTEDEIYEKAKNELYAMERNYSNALSNCGVYCSRCTTEELIDMFYTYSSPISSVHYKVDDIENLFSSYVVTSDSKDVLRNDALEEIQLKMDLDYYEEMNDTRGGANEQNSDVSFNVMKEQEERINVDRRDENKKDVQKPTINKENKLSPKKNADESKIESTKSRTIKKDNNLKMNESRPTIIRTRPSMARPTKQIEEKPTTERRVRPSSFIR